MKIFSIESNQMKTSTGQAIGHAACRGMPLIKHFGGKMEENEDTRIAPTYISF